MNKAVCIILAASAASSSFAFGISDIVNWTGTGSNQAVAVIDFHDGQTYQSFAWGYRWDGTSTGEDMMNAIAAADPQLQMDLDHYSFGDAINTLTYDGTPFGLGLHSKGGFSSDTTGFWGYYLGNGSDVPAWNGAQAGFSDVTLANDDWNGWSWAENFNMVPPSDPIYAAPQAVPEPAELVPLALAGIALILRRRR